MLFDTKNKLSSQELTDKVISDYNSGVSVDLIISYLEEETRKPTGSSKIDLQTCKSFEFTCFQKTAAVTINAHVEVN